MGYRISELSMEDFKKKKVWIERIEENYKKQKEEETHDNICCEMPEVRLAPADTGSEKRPEGHDEMLQVRENIKGTAAPKDKRHGRSAKIHKNMEGR